MAINSITELWDLICEDCRKNDKISEVGLKTWILDLIPVSSDDGVLTLSTNNEYKKRTVDGYYKKILENGWISKSKKGSCNIFDSKIKRIRYRVYDKNLYVIYRLSKQYLSLNYRFFDQFLYPFIENFHRKTRPFAAFCC